MQMLKVGFSLAFLFHSGLCIHWDYTQGDHGPASWGNIFPSCVMESQSPIDFKSAESKPARDMPLMLEGYDQRPTSVKIINNGHSVNTEFSTKNPLYMYGGGLCTGYKLAQMHIHWGSSNNQGSEHTLDGKSYPAEFHFVHYKAEFEAFKDSLVDPVNNTLAVLGVWAELSERDNPNLAPLLNNLEKVHSKVGEYAQIMSFPVSLLLPKDLTSFYRYQGSLTTPACNQIVTWTVATNTIPISKAQLDKLRALKQINGEPLVDNFRPVQPINGRQVQRITTYSIMKSGQMSNYQISSLTTGLMASVLYAWSKQF